MGSIRQRGRIWWIQYYRAGRRYEESARSDRWEVARDLLRNREGDIAKGLPVTAKMGRLKFDDAAADVVTDYRVNGRRSLGEVERRIKLHLGPFFGGRRMAAITTTDVRAYTDHRQRAGASNAEINRELAILKRAYTLAVQAGRLLYRPHIPMLEEHNVRTGFFEPAQFRSVREHLPEDLRDVAAFAYITGWRVPSELLTLEWRQVDLDAKTVRLDPGSTKNDEGRLFPFGAMPDLDAAIMSRRKVADARERARAAICPWVFHRDGRSFLDASGRPSKGFRDDWKAACKAAGCPGKIPHDFRRTAVRNLVRAGVSEKTAMLLTGHKTRCVFDRYNIVNEADLRAAVGRLAVDSEKQNIKRRQPPGTRGTKTA